MQRVIHAPTWELALEMAYAVAAPRLMARFGWVLSELWDSGTL